MTVIAPRILDFGRIVLNLIFYSGSKTQLKGVDITFKVEYWREQTSK